MCPSWLTQGDLKKALPLVPQSLHNEGFCGVSPASGAVWGSEIRVLVTRSRCGEDTLPGLRETGPHTCSPATIGVLVCGLGPMGHPFRVYGGETEEWVP